jgi:serine/threonine protein kinase
MSSCVVHAQKRYNPQGHQTLEHIGSPSKLVLMQDMVKICDFGWSVNCPTLRSTHCGTPLYSSPEVVLKKQYDSKIDVWNIGVLTY